MIAEMALAALPDADRLRDWELERRLLARLLREPAQLREVERDLFDFVGHQHIREAMDSILPATLSAEPLKSLWETMEASGTPLTYRDSVVAVVEADALDPQDLPAAVERLRELARGREARRELLKTEAAWSEPDPESALGASNDVAGQAFNATDLGNAERFVARHGDRVRYVAALGDWLVWDGRRWVRDRDDEVRRLAAETARAIYTEAAAVGTQAARQALALHAARSESQPRLVAMLESAKSMRPIAALPETFDGRGTTYLLNVENGTLDLLTGNLREHRQEDHITRLAPVNFDPDARCDAWDRFLARMVPSPEVRDFLRRFAGYTMTGSTGEEVLLFAHGPEAAGKSTFVEALKATLGDYAATAEFESFLRKRGDAGVRDDIARLAGVRMALSLEMDDGRHLAEGLVKNLTGGDTVTARHLYGRFFEFRPAFKLWLVANHRPEASADDGALWRRILLVPFTVSLPEGERDPAVKAALTENPDARAAILGWALRGCLEWRQHGLNPPDEVRQATAAYRAACDHVGVFLADIAAPTDGSIAAGEMQGRYKGWCELNGEKPLAANRLGEALKRHGLTAAKSDGVRSWRWPGHRDTRGRQIQGLFPNGSHERSLAKLPPSGVPVSRSGVGP